MVGVQSETEMMVKVNGSHLRKRFNLLRHYSVSPCPLFLKYTITWYNGDK